MTGDEHGPASKFHFEGGVLRITPEALAELQSQSASVDFSAELGLEKNSFGHVICRESAPERIVRELNKLRDTGVSVIFIDGDINDLKKANDSLGHPRADALMAGLFRDKVTSLLRLPLEFFFFFRPQDGGDEYCMVLGFPDGELARALEQINVAMGVPHEDRRAVMRSGFGITGGDYAASRSSSESIESSKQFLLRLRRKAEKNLRAQKEAKARGIEKAVMRLVDRLTLDNMDEIIQKITELFDAGRYAASSQKPFLHKLFDKARELERARLNDPGEPWKYG